MITRCPTCNTAFRVTEAQLSARGGQVRCGACTHVFDASASLQELTPAQTQADLANPSGEPMILPDTAPALSPELVATFPAAPAIAPKAEADSFATPAQVAVAARTISAIPNELPFGPPAIQARTRGPMGAGILMLTFLLVAQGLFYFRSDIAVLVPASKPLIKESCALLGCSIQLPHRSDLMTIEASDLQADGVNASMVILSATLRNRAAFPQAHPALELTLTDTQDLPLARRVLQAADYLDSPPDNENGFAAGAERAIRVTLQLADLKATGYRLYLFYP